MYGKIFCVLTLSFLFLAFCGCITSHVKPEQPIEVHKLNIIARNFSELLELGVPLECAVSTSSGTMLVQIKNGTFRCNTGEYSVMRQDGLLYMRVPESRRAEFNCEWILVNESDDVSWQFREFNPLNESIQSLPPGRFSCDVAYISDGDFYPSGKVCWFFDLKSG